MRTNKNAPVRAARVPASENSERDDTSDLIANAIRFGIIGRVNRQGVPATVRNGLRINATSGELACALVLEWLDDLLLADLEAAERRARA
ncbi:hypothetical protein OF122_01470 [Pelagibacterium flavum]|uniref:Uncharacterized protein n=1 Tax=Pelagibacterium flavum TaxID=2984530 RepID=A0ABY6IT60_9HYPH|nr:hypothetical protein [Pelagibacterium sp. YIM 151497]UYQ72487.1 hypothetical protein OF122_01470 [Pelagibacterium sp. YIM 151497]